MADSPLVAYLKQVHITHATGGGTKERSHYPALKALFDGVGARLKPRVHCVTDLASIGADFPDFGLFTDDQLTPDGALKASVAVPARGAGEVKGVDHDLDALTESAQVSKYWDRYHQVLVTNLRQFAFVSEDAHGHPIVLERLTLAETPGAFWATAAHADRLAGSETEAAALAFVERCLRHAAPVESPRDEAAARLRAQAAEPAAVAKLALQDRPQLREKLGLLERS